MSHDILDLFESLESPIEIQEDTSIFAEEIIDSFNRANEEYLSNSFENMIEERKIQQLNSEYSQNYLVG